MKAKGGGMKVMAEAAVGKRFWHERVYPAWLPLVLAMGLVWRRRWWRFVVGGLNRPLIFLALFAWSFKGTAAASHLHFLVPGLAALAAVSGSYGDLVNWFTLRRKYFQVLDECLLAPVSTRSLLVGHLIGGGAKGLVVAALVYLSGWAVAGGLCFNPLFLLQLAVIAFTFAALAVAVAMVANGDKDVLIFTNLVVLPMTFFCGTFFPVEGLPGVLSKLAWFLPLTAGTYHLRALALGEPVHWGWLAQSIGWFCALYTLAYLLLCWRRQD
ncbi:MAG: ABC transporter permease [Bacillota bacterium]